MKKKASKLLVDAGPEREILDVQIKMMWDKAMSRPLSLEETKILDLLIANKVKLTGETQTIESSADRIIDSLTDEQLINLIYEAKEADKEEQDAAKASSDE